MGAKAEGALLLVFFKSRYKKYEESKKENKVKSFSFSSDHRNSPS